MCESENALSEWTRVRACALNWRIKNQSCVVQRKRQLKRTIADWQMGTITFTGISFQKFNAVPLRGAWQNAGVLLLQLLVFPSEAFAIACRVAYIPATVSALLTHDQKVS